MAITSQDGLIAGLGSAQRLVLSKAASGQTFTAGRTYSAWTLAGNPGAGSTTLGQAATGYVPTVADNGAILFTNPTGGNFSYLGGLRGISSTTGLIILADILWVWGSGGSGWSVTTTGAQSTSSPAALTRPDANGVGTELWMENLSTGGSASGTSTITYTNSAGTGSRTASLLASKVSSPVTGTVEYYTLAAGDTGVASVQSINNSATWTSGTYRLMIVRRVAELPVTANTGFSFDAYDLGLSRVYDSACLVPFFVTNGTTAGTLNSSISLPQG